MTKTCKRCGTTKAVSEFHAHKMMADGVVNFCKECVNAAARQRRNDNLEEHRERERIRNSAPEVKERKKLASSSSGSARSKKWDSGNPEKKAAHQKVKRALLAGELKKQPCEVCGATERIHGHHEDYSRPLSVIWFCSKHHREHHRDHLTDPPSREYEAWREKTKHWVR